MKKWLIAMVGLTMVLSACGDEFTSSENPLPYDKDNRDTLVPEVRSQSGGDDKSDGGGITEIPDGLTDGVYTTTGEGFGGDITVETTIEGGKIVSIEILSHGESPGISDGAINDLPGIIISEYSLGVDNISGASWSSKGIKAAVEAAIKEASGAGGGGGDSEAGGIVEIPDGLTDGEYTTTGEGFKGDITVKTTVEGGKIVAIEVLDHSDTPGVSDGAINDLPNTIISEYSLGVDNVSGASWSSKGIKAAVEAAINEASAGGGSDEAAAGAGIPDGLNDGEYTTTGEGFKGDITVKTTVEGGKIVAIEVLDHSDTPGVSDGAINDLPNTIISEYSLDVDNVSGASWSSKGIKAAVEAAIAEAQ